MADERVPADSPTPERLRALLLIEEDYNAVREYLRPLTTIDPVTHSLYDWLTRILGKAEPVTREPDDETPTG